MQCWQVIVSMPEFLADRLPPYQAAELEAHLTGCESCWAAYLESQDEAGELNALDQALANPALTRMMTTEPPPLPLGWSAQLINRIDWAPPVPAPVRWWAKALRHPAVSGTYAAAAAILVFSVAQRLFLWQTTTDGLGALLLQGELWLAMLGNQFFQASTWAANLLHNLF